MEFQAKWIQAPGKAEDVCPVFCRTWKSAGTVKKAELYLTALGVTVTIAARKYSDLAWAKVYGCEGIHIGRMAEVAGNFDYIVNTVPAKLFDHGVLSKLKDRCLVLDLASKPGGAGNGDKKRVGCIWLW